METIENSAPVLIKKESIGPLQSEHSINEQPVFIKQERLYDDEDISREVAELAKKLSFHIESTKHKPEGDGFQTDDFAVSKNCSNNFAIKKQQEQTSEITQKNSPKRKRFNSSDSETSINSSSFNKKEYGHNSKTKHKTESSSNSRRRKRKHRRRSKSNDKNKKDRLSSKSTSEEKHIKFSSLYSLNDDNSNKLVLDYNHGGQQSCRKHSNNNELSKTSRSESSSNTHTNHEHTTTIANLKPISVKKELNVLPQKINVTSIKQEKKNSDTEEAVQLPLPILVHVKVEKTTEALSKKQISRKYLHNSQHFSKKAEEMCTQALNNFKNNQCSKKIYYTRSKCIEPSSNITEYQSPVFRANQEYCSKAYFSYSSFDVQYANFGMISLPPITTTVARILGYDISQLIDKINEYQGDLSKLRYTTSDISTNAVNAYSNLVKSRSTQTDMIPCIQCAHRNLRKKHDVEVQSIEVPTSEIAIQTNRETAMIEKLRTANSNQLISLSDFFELLILPQTEPDTFSDRVRLRDTLLAIFDKGQAPDSRLTAMQLPRIIEPSPGISANTGNQYMVVPNQIPICANNVFYTQHVQQQSSTSSQPIYPNPISQNIRQLASTDPANQSQGHLTIGEYVQQQPSTSTQAIYSNPIPQNQSYPIQQNQPYPIQQNQPYPIPQNQPFPIPQNQAYSIPQNQPYPQHFQDFGNNVTYLNSSSQEAATQSQGHTSIGEPPRPPIINKKDPRTKRTNDTEMMQNSPLNDLHSDVSRSPARLRGRGRGGHRKKSAIY